MQTRALKILKHLERENNFKMSLFIYFRSEWFGIQTVQIPFSKPQNVLLFFFLAKIIDFHECLIMLPREYIVHGIWMLT